MIIEPIRSALTPFDLMPERVLTKKSMSRMQASSNQHSEENWEGDFDWIVAADSGGCDCFFILV